MPLGSQVKKYRHEVLRMKYPELSELSGVETGTLHAIETRDSKRVEIGTAIAIAKAFGLTVEELANEESDYSERVKAHHAVRYSKTTPTVSHLASESTTRQWPTNYWPFASISPDTFKSALSTDDIERIEAYARAIIDTREADRLKNAV